MRFERIGLAVLAVYFAGIGASLAKADVFRYIDENGTIHFTDTLPKTMKFKRMKIVPESPGISKPRTPSRTTAVTRTKPVSRPGQSVVAKSAYGPFIQTISNKYAVDPVLVHSIVWVESNFEPNAISPKGAKGLMQLMPETARSYEVRNAFDPRENIEGGVRYLSHLMRTYDSNLRLVLAAYNAGESMVNRYNGVPPFPETRDYIEKVMREHQRMRRELGGRWAESEAAYANGAREGSEKVYRYRMKDGSYLLSDQPNLESVSGGY